MEQMTVDTQAVVLRYVAQVGTKAEAIREFNQLLESPVTPATFYNWCNGVYRPDPRIMREAMRVYMPEDWRYRMAAEIRAILIES